MADLEFFTDPGDFLRAADEYLGRDPVLNTVVATVSQRLRDEIADGVAQDDSFARWWLLVRDAEGEITGAAMRTADFAPYPLFVLPLPDDAAVDLARALHARGEEVGGVNGALPGTRLCAEELARLTGGVATVGVHTRLFELGGLVPPRPAGGHLRQAVADDVELALAWFAAFARDADEQAGRPPDSHHEPFEDRPSMLRRVDGGRLWFWVDDAGERVHLTGANAPAFGAVRLGPVYTPPAQRGRGYASAAVAEVSRRIVAGGARACLFTDQANPTSNKIYEALGYRPVVDMANMRVLTDRRTGGRVGPVGAARGPRGRRRPW